MVVPSVVEGVPTVGSAETVLNCTGECSVLSGCLDFGAGAPTLDMTADGCGEGTIVHCELCIVHWELFCHSEQSAQKRGRLTTVRQPRKFRVGPI